MTNQELLEKIIKIENILPEDSGQMTGVIREVFFIQTIQFVRTYIGTETEFYARLAVYSKDESSSSNLNQRWFIAKCVLDAIKLFLKNDIDFKETATYKIKNDIVSDLLMQAHKLLKDHEYHPAAAVILIGAVLEEFLRMLIDIHSITIPNADKGSISVYAQELAKINILNKQDSKDITSWAGLRNEATHGHFEDVNDRKRVKNALEGVNLFIRRMNINNNI
jgi:uncharacterized protein YutE (UPF0331/DUF86 family)